MANPKSIRLGCIFVLIFCTDFLTASKRCEGDDDFYVIKSTERGDIVLDATDPRQISIQRFIGADTQLWKFQSAGKPGLYYILNKHHNKVMDFNLGDDGHFHLAVNELAKCLQQRWILDNHGHIVNVVNDKNVDILNADYTPGNRVIVWKDNGCACQKFVLKKV